MSTSYSPKIVTDGLVLYLDAGNTKSYPGSGTTWIDVSGNARTGTLSGATLPTFNGVNNGVFTLNGTTGFVLTNYTPVVGSGNITYTCWFKTSVSQTTGMMGFRGTNTLQSVLVMSATNLYMSSYDGTTNRVGTTTSTWVDNLWHCAVMVHTSTTDTLYVDGTFQLQNTSAAQNINNIQPLIIGGLPNDNTLLAGWGFNGSMANVQVYNKALTVNEILQNFNATRGRFGV